MRFKILFLGLAVVAFACGLFAVSAQQPGDDEVLVTQVVPAAPG